MSSYPFGAVAMVGILLAALSGADLAIFLNAHAIILVLGGTLAVLALSTPWQTMGQLIKTLAQIRKKEKEEDPIAEGLKILAKNKLSETKQTHALITYAQSLWEEGIEKDLFTILLHQRKDKLNQASAQPVATIRNLAKYPPALGMMGTVLGIVTLFAKLTPESHNNLGPSLALAMTATFYGLVLANALLMPLADRLYVLHLSETKLNEHLFDILMLIHRGENSQLIEESLNVA